MSATAATDCSPIAAGSAAYMHSTEAVRRLPEFRAWSRTHSFPIAFNAAVDGQIFVDGRCFWSVAVFANRPERLELWNVFAVSPRDGVSYVDDPTVGEFITLKAWRARLQSK